MHNIRAKQYALLSRLLTDQSRASDLPVYISWVEDLMRNQEGILDSFLHCLQGWQNKKDADQTLQVEFGHLFLLPVGVKPFESAYRSKEKLLMQESWVQVKKFYGKCGVKLDNSFGHPEDHAAIELSFMAHLVAGGTEKALEEEFFLQHINPWIPQFFQDLRDNQYAVFFRCVAEYGLFFLESEKNRFSKTS